MSENRGQEIFPIIASRLAILYKRFIQTNKNYGKGSALEDTTVYRLNELFKWLSGDKKLHQAELMMTFTTATGCKVSVHPSTPHDTASYLRRFMKSDDPLFRPGEVRCDSVTEKRSRPGSILFKGFGFVRDNANHQHYKTMLHMRFTGVEQPLNIGEMEARGYVSFHDDFGDDPQEPLHVVTGPTVHEFIRTLEAAGNNWSGISFRTSNTRLNTSHTPMQLIKR